MHSPEYVETQILSGETLEQRYERLCSEVSDINEHLPKLRELASKCRHVTEFGTRLAVSTTALLAAKPETVVTYDIVKDCQCRSLESIAEGTSLVIKAGPEFNTAAMPTIEPTDMLLVDDLHIAEHIAAELLLHSPMVSKFIVFHDTRPPWGDVSEDGSSGGGVNGGIALWLATDEGRKWDKHYESDRNHGLVVFGRVR